MRELGQPAKVRLIDEGGLKGLFEHVRNLLMATVIIAVGTYVGNKTSCRRRTVRHFRCRIFPDTPCSRLGS